MPEPLEAEARRAALERYGILDTPRDISFDEVVEVLAEICEAPISAISLLDGERQWFKAEVGIGVRETPIDVSFCAHAVGGGELMIVPDARDDARFRDNALVTGQPNIRFYAGAVIRTDEGVPLGTVCVIDTKPRIFDMRQQRMIQLMARQVMRQIELDRLLREERRARERAEALAVENEVLAREIDHRVKNSLQLVSSMLALQGRQTIDPAVRAQLNEAEQRVRSIAAVHEQLHRSTEPGRVAVDQFLSSLCAVLARNKAANVDLACRADPATLPSDLAVSLGLLVNELVANGFKHAFPDGRAGRVAVIGSRHGDDYELLVSDDGIGTGKVAQPGGSDGEPGDGSGGGMGQRILGALAQRLGGSLQSVAQPRGMAVKVRFPLSRDAVPAADGTGADAGRPDARSDSASVAASDDGTASPPLADGP